MGTSVEFREFIADEWRRLDQDAQEVGTAGDEECVAVVTVMKYRSDGFVTGSKSDCGGAEFWWSDQFGQWQEVYWSNGINGCSEMSSFVFPRDMSPVCFIDDQRSRPYGRLD